MSAALLLFVAIALAAALIGSWVVEAHLHRRRIATMRWRVHVNGTRGKSTVTRLIASVFRAAGIPTIGKATGSATMIIGLDGADVEIPRRGHATILEQIDSARRASAAGAQAFVVECMALQPRNQEVSEEQMIRSNIGVLTNVREDHQDVMGFSRAEIARSMLSTCPHDGVLVTAEQDPQIHEIMRRETARRGSSLVVIDPESVADDEVKAFDYYSFKENIAIGLAVASIAGIDRATAMRGMIGAAGDPGVLRLRRFQVGAKRVTWANLFAINDAESVIKVVDELLAKHRDEETTTVGLLNNRADREDRALQFADVAARHLRLDRIATLGAYERTVRARLIAHGFPAQRILPLGDSRRPTSEEMTRRLILDTPTPHVLLIGMVNIHTAQADQLLGYFESAA